MNRSNRAGIFLLVLMLSWGGASQACVSQTSATVIGTHDMDDSTKAWNIPLPTLGGKQFWTDHRWWYGWRVQYNNTLDHWRLLDPNDVRRAWGGRQAMLDELELVIRNHEPIEAPDEFVILLHGLMRTSGSMGRLAQDILDYDEEAAARGDAQVDKWRRVPFAVSYASTRDSITHHSEALHN